MINGVRHDGSDVLRDTQVSSESPELSPLCRTASVHLEIRKTHLLEGKPHSLVALVYSDSSYTSCCSVRRAVGLCLSVVWFTFSTTFLAVGNVPCGLNCGSVDTRVNVLSEHLSALPDQVFDKCH